MDGGCSSTKKVNLCFSNENTWTNFVKLGMCVVADTSTSHFVCRHRMSIFNTIFACLFWLANNKKGRYPEFFMGYFDESWYIGSGGHKYYLCGLSSPNADSQRPEEQFSTVLVSDCQKDIFQQCWFLTLGRTFFINVASDPRKDIIAMAMPNKPDLQNISWHSHKGGPRYIFCEYSECISQEPQNLVIFQFFKGRVSNSNSIFFRSWIRWY